MRVFGLWHGGNGNYSLGEMPTDGESWDTLNDAKQSLRDRYYNGHWYGDMRGSVVNVDEDGIATIGEPSNDLRPAVGDDTTIDLYPAEKVGKGKWRIGSEPYIRLSLDNRKRVRVERF